MRKRKRPTVSDMIERDSRLLLESLHASLVRCETILDKIDAREMARKR